MLILKKDYAIACESLSIAASSLAIIFLWIAGIEMCVESKTAKKRVSEILIAGTLLIGKSKFLKLYLNKLKRLVTFPN